ncbi:hypothetical protein MCOR02_010725 [Pyricularia oryzae]|nr:hypothetical protein MCOR02_010725 [Pyricularia oryzae]KAI6474072.1 hypothetical protein MCOR17_002346 [Pyricularia oryzae]KAI6505370.1 hypothetical protein MCOR13_004168 [Pyricularia oryzae]KAI6605585.1 hypothetical protein MCOR04_001089 [Pyricularia oryzae]
MITRRPPTCLGCLRRALAPSMNGSSSSNASVALTQVRGKTKTARNKDEEGGLVVRLLKNIPEYGPKNTILRAPRGRVRNMWYPDGKVEYMTPQRFAELGVNESAIVERDPMYGLEVEKPVEKKAVRSKAADDKVVKIQPPKPQEATALLNNLLPKTLTFERAVIPAGVKSKQDSPSAEENVYRSPLVARNASVSHESAANAPPQPIAIFGSVSTADVAARVKELLSSHRIASLVAIEAKHVSIEGALLEDGDVVRADDPATAAAAAVEGDKVKQLGRWEITIEVPGGAKEGVKPIEKILEVVGMADKSA